MQTFFHRLRKLSGCAIVIAVFAGASMVRAQHAGPPSPYASIASKGVTYAGPRREAAYDLAGPTIHIGLLAPLHGPQQADGEAIVKAAQMALQDASKQPLPGGLHLALSVADESVPPWGLLGDEIIHLVMQDKVVAIVTCADGVATHLSEQIGNKIGVATLTLSSDDTATEINMPWIFRLGPSDDQQAQVIARNIYRERGFRRVLLVRGRDHDGRMGGREFVEVARRLRVPAPVSQAIDPLRPDANALLAVIKTNSPQAIVFWTQPENAKILLQAIHAEGIHVPVYLSQETAQVGSGLGFNPQRTAGVKDPSGVGIYTVDSQPDKVAPGENFACRYQAATGRYPSPVVAEAYDSVRLVARAVREAGPNRARVRDHILTTQEIAGAAGIISFDSQGNNRAEACLVRLQ